MAEGQQAVLAAQAYGLARPDLTLYEGKVIPPPQTPPKCFHKDSPRQELLGSPQDAVGDKEELSPPLSL